MSSLWMVPSLAGIAVASLRPRLWVLLFVMMVASAVALSTCDDPEEDARPEDARPEDTDRLLVSARMASSVPNPRRVAERKEEEEETTTHEEVDPLLREARAKRNLYSREALRERRNRLDAAQAKEIRQIR